MIPVTFGHPENFASYFFFIDMRSSYFNQDRLQKDSPCRSVFCLLLPSFDTRRFRIILSRVQPLSAFLVPLVSTEMLSLRTYHQTFLPDGQPIPFFWLLLLLQYLVFYTQNCTSSLLLILRPLWSFIGPYIFLSILRSYVLRVISLVVSVLMFHNHITLWV